MHPITKVLSDYNEGAFANDATDELHRLIADCAATGKKGALVIKIELKPAKSATPALLLSIDCTTKSPNFDTPAEYMFVTRDGGLSRDNPQQRSLELREVPPRTGAVPPGVDPDTGEIVAA